MVTSPKWTLRAVLTIAKLWARSKRIESAFTATKPDKKNLCESESNHREWNSSRTARPSENHLSARYNLNVFLRREIVPFLCKWAKKVQFTTTTSANSHTKTEGELQASSERVGGHWSAFKKGHHKGSNHQTFTFTFILMVHASPRNRSLFQTEMKLSWSSFRLTLLVQLHSQIPPSLSVSLPRPFLPNTVFTL